MCAQKKQDSATTNVMTDTQAAISFKRHWYWIIKESIYSNFIIS